MYDYIYNKKTRSKQMPANNPLTEKIYIADSIKSITVRIWPIVENLLIKALI